MKKMVLSLFLLTLFLELRSQNKMLFVGNSITYVNDFPSTFENICLNLGVDIQIKMLAFPGFSLKQHITGYMVATQNSNFVYFKRLNKDGTETSELIKELTKNKWDYIFLQDRALDEDSISFALNKIREFLPNSRIILFENYLSDSKWSEKYDRRKKRMNYKNAIDLAKGIDAEVLFVSEYFEDIKRFASGELLYDETFHPTVFGSKIIAITLFKTLFPDYKLIDIVNGLNLTSDQWELIKHIKIR